MSWNGDDDGNGRFIAPVPGMTQEQIDMILGAVTDEHLKGAIVGYSLEEEPLRAHEFRSVIQLENIGDGKYFLNWPGAGRVRDKDGKEYEFDLLNLLEPLAHQAVKNDIAARKARRQITDEEKEALGLDPNPIPDATGRIRDLPLEGQNLR